MTDNVVRLDDYRKTKEFAVPLLENCTFTYSSVVSIDGATYFLNEYAKYRREWLDD